MNESIVGDLIERYETRRSLPWLWWQTLTTIGVVTTADIRTHKLLAVRALAIGWAAPWLLLAMLRTPVRNLSALTGKPIWNWTVEHRFDSLRTLWFGGLGGVGGPLFLTLLFVFAVTGWILGRLHRSRQAALVTLYAASTPIVAGAWLVHESSLTHPTWTFLFLALPLSGLLGGCLTLKSEV